MSFGFPNLIQRRNAHGWFQIQSNLLDVVPTRLPDSMRSGDKAAYNNQQDGGTIPLEIALRLRVTGV